LTPVQTSQQKASRRLKVGLPTIGDQLSDRHNSLNFLRLVLAGTVLVAHAAELGGFDGWIFIRTTDIGTIAVFGFFGISGYLIACSASRNNSIRYIWQRFLRIFPGFWVALVMTAFFFGVIAWAHSPLPHCDVGCYLGLPNGPVEYVYRNALLQINQPTVASRGVGLYLGNSSIWTLFYEFGCYLILLGLAVCGALRRRWMALVATGFAWGVSVLFMFVPALQKMVQFPHNWTEMNLLKFVPIFMVGSVIYLYRECIPDSGWLALACVATFVAGLWLPTNGKIPFEYLTPTALFAPLIAYPLLWLGIHLPFAKIGARNDYSYGVYIYAWPITQVLVVLGAVRLGRVPFVMLAAVAVVPFAAASWWWIEKPAMSLRKIPAPAIVGRMLGPKPVASDQ